MEVAEKKSGFVLAALIVCAACAGCERNVAGNDGKPVGKEELVSLEEVARMLSSVRLGEDRMGEVFDAVRASVDNGYDEEYMISDLLSSPGRGVGQERVKSALQSEKSYGRPMRDLFAEFCAAKASACEVKSGGAADNEYMRYLLASDMQIYWPDSGNWDMKESPVVTFAPEDESAVSNVGFFLNDDGEIEEVQVNEEMAGKRPVWVVNRNDDSPFVSLEIMKKNNPGWEEGGSLEIRSSEKHSGGNGKMLVLKSFKMLRHYDSWLRGASEFFIKMGALESFSASTEAEMKLYDPEITDFMVVVRRKEVGMEKDLGAILVSDWTEQLEDCAFMVIEDDGGSMTTWKCSGTVKINSKSYGFDISIPFRSYDDIVWRGKLSRKYLDSAPLVTGRFGDTELTFSTQAY